MKRDLKTREERERRRRQKEKKRILGKDNNKKRKLNIYSQIMKELKPDNGF